MRCVCCEKQDVNQYGDTYCNILDKYCDDISEEEKKNICPKCDTKNLEYYMCRNCN